MSTRMLWFTTLMLAAMGMSMGAAHVLELPAKMRYDAQMYVAINRTLYPFFAIVGGTVQVVAILAALWLVVRLRAERIFSTTLLGWLCLLGSLVLWFVLVQPVNTEWSHLSQSAPEAMTAAYARLRNRWEFGHVAAFAVWLLGVGTLVYAAVQDRPD